MQLSTFQFPSIHIVAISLILSLSCLQTSAVPLSNTFTNSTSVSPSALARRRINPDPYDGFSHDCQTWTLKIDKDQAVLEAFCRGDKFGTPPLRSQLDLTKCMTNAGGNLMCQENGGWKQSCDGHVDRVDATGIPEVELQCRDADPHAKFNLDTCVVVSGGVLYCREIPEGAPFGTFPHIFF